jgi:hypothetical protein
MRLSQVQLAQAGLKAADPGLAGAALVSWFMRPWKRFGTISGFCFDLRKLFFSV